MKKNLFIGLITLVVMCLAGCNSNAPQLYMKSIYLTINKDEWKFDDKAKQFYAHFNLPEITADVFNYGNYSIHREYNTGTSDVYQVALPQSLYLSEQVQDTDSTTVTVYYQQLVDYRIGPKFVEIQVTNSDFYYAGYTPEAMLFHLQLTY